MQLASVWLITIWLRIISMRGQVARSPSRMNRSSVSNDGLEVTLA